MYHILSFIIIATQILLHSSCSYSQISVSSNSVTDRAKGVDSLSVLGDLAFVYEHLQNPPKINLAGMQNLPHLSSVIEKSRVEKSLVSIAGNVLGFDPKFVFKSAKLTDFGDGKSFWWKVTWQIFPTDGGFSGSGLEFSVICDSTGKPIAPRVFLVRRSGSPFETIEYSTLFSSICLEHSSKKNLDPEGEPRALTAAIAKVRERLNARGINPGISVDEVSIREISSFRVGKFISPKRVFWQINLRVAGSPKNGVADSTIVTMWVDADFNVSELTIDAWDASEQKRK
jgi:hypothetical protein